MKLCNLGHDFDYELEKLIRLFLPFEKIEIQERGICEKDEKKNPFSDLIFFHYGLWNP